MPDPEPMNASFGPVPLAAPAPLARERWERLATIRSSCSQRFPGRPAKLPLGTVAVTVALAFTLGPRPAAGQDLELKREAQIELSFECGPAPSAPQPGTEDRARAAQLASEASEAVILGDRARARGLLAEAVRLDPQAADLAYRYARILDETDQPGPALDAYCRALAIEPDGLNAPDAQRRVEALADQTQAGVPQAAIRDFSNGVALAEIGQLENALASFDRAIAEVPDWSAAHYNRGLVLLRTGRLPEAEAALSRYLELAPDAPDVIAVSRRVGTLQAQRAAPSVSPSAALGVGLLPGMGQMYTGRPADGLAFMGMAGAATAGAFLYERGEGRRFFTPGLSIAGTVVGIGALDAYLHARRQRQGGAFVPDPSTALALGILPGLGQMYSGRTPTGLAFLALTGGLLGMSDVAESGTDRRFVFPGLVITGSVWALGGIEAAMHLRRRQSSDPPDPWNAFGLGLLVPGLGQFYAGRTGMGLTVVSIVAAGTATAFLYEEGRGRGLFSEGLTVGGVGAGLGAIEAYFGARRVAREGATGSDGGFALADGAATLYGPALVGAGRDGVRVELARLTF